MNESGSTFELLERAGTVTLIVCGDLDLVAREEFAGALTALVERATVSAAVDLRGVTFIDSSGLGELVRSLEAAKARGLELILAAPSAQTRRVLELSGLAELFTIHD